MTRFMEATPATLEFEGINLVLVKDGVRLGVPMAVVGHALGFYSEDVALLWDAAHWGGGSVSLLQNKDRFGALNVQLTRNGS